MTTISSKPLRLAHELFSDIAHPTNLSDFTRHLTAIHYAAYLLLLPQTCRAEVTFRQTETTRIATGPLGDAVLEATTLFLLNTCRHGENDDLETATRMQHEDIYEATARMLPYLAAEEERYLDNMTVLLTDMKRKWASDLVETGSWHRTALTMQKSGIASALALYNFVGYRPAPQRSNGGNYLGEIARYWRRWGGTGEAGTYEEVWSYVAGRALVQE